MTQKLNWFKDRIGKRIYRGDNACGCLACKEVFKNGIVVNSEYHAQYLYNMQNDFGAEGIELNYRDEK